MTAKSILYTSLAVLFLINLLNFYDRSVGGALVEPIKHEFKLSDQEIGLLGSALGLQEAMLVVPLLLFLLAVVLYAGSRTAVADINRRQAVAVPPAPAA